MQLTLKTILNLKEKHSGFVYGDIRLIKGNRIEILVEPRVGSQGTCSGCGKKCPGYDQLAQRKFIHVPLWGLQVVLLYSMRRLQCVCCGVVVELVPWGLGKSPITQSYAWFLSEWAKIVSMKEVARQFKSTWHHVFTAVTMAVDFGREHLNLSGITAIGVDEIHWAKNSFMTLVYQIDNHCKRLLWCGEKRTEKTINTFFSWFGKERSLALQFVCSDMWKPYLKSIANHAKQALNILDRFHIAQKLSQAVDKVRTQETRQLIKKGQPVTLKHSRWVLLKNPQNLNPDQKVKLKELLNCNLKTIRAYLLKEYFKQFWEYTSPTWAGKFLDDWCKQVMRSKLEPMKKVAKTIRSHKSLILNWFEAKNQISLGAVEGLNNKAKVVIKKSYGFKTSHILKISLYHKLGKLPVPILAHKYF